MRVFLLSVACVALAACAHAQKKEETVAVKPPPPPRVAEAPPAPVQETCSADSMCGDGKLCLNGTCVAITPELAECSAMRVHFEFNQAVIQTQDEQTLQRMARCLKAASKLHVTIEGNTDERGTEEYNMHLGQKRASAVEDYLTTLGASRAQLNTISYGYEHPICSEANESCWSQNRRAAMKPDLAKTP